MTFMPRQLSSAEIEQIVADVVQELGAKDMKDAGRVMKTIMGKVAGAADGKVVSEMVRNKLSP